VAALPKGCAMKKMIRKFTRKARKHHKKLGWLAAFRVFGMTVGF
jgi:hypothetical protein